eukprot:gene1660-430_t
MSALCQICGDFDALYLCNHENCGFKTCQQCLDFSHRGSKKPHLKISVKPLKDEETTDYSKESLQKIKKYEELLKKHILSQVEFDELKENLKETDKTVKEKPKEQNQKNVEPKVEMKSEPIKSVEKPKIQPTKNVEIKQQEVKDETKKDVIKQEIHEETPEIDSDFNLDSFDFSNKNSIISHVFSLHYIREFEKINQICEKYLKENPNDKVVLCYYGESLANLHSHKLDGTQILQDLIATDPDDVDEMFAVAKANMILQNNETMVFWMKTAAQNGNMYAQFTLAQCYAQGYGVEKSDSQSYNWFKKSAEQGLSLGNSNLALCYKFGKGVDKNLNSMIHYLNKSIEKNDAFGYYQLGLCYMKGLGVPHDSKKKFDCFMASAKQNYSKAQIEVGQCYEDGDGVESNLKLAFEC